MKKLLLILLSVLSLTAMAQERKTIVIQQPQSDDEMLADLVRGKLTAAFASSEEWQPIERSTEMLMKMTPEEVSKLQPPQYILITEIQDVFGELSISCRITEIETTRMIGHAREMCEPSLRSIQQACSSLAKQLLEKQE